MPEDQASRGHRRAATRPYVMTVVLRGETREGFINRFHADVVQGGMFVRTGGDTTPPLGALVALRFIGAAGASLFSGCGQVHWIRRGAHGGVGLRLSGLGRTSAAMHQIMLMRKRTHALAHSQRVTEFDQTPTIKRSAAIPPVRASPRAF